jgi:hypothetical protein
VPLRAPTTAGSATRKHLAAVPRIAGRQHHHAPLLAAAASAGTGLICGGADPVRRNITNPLITALDGGSGLPRLDTGQLRATWLADCAPLAAFEQVIDASGVEPQVEAALPSGVRERQLTVRTLLAGMCLSQADHRPAHLTRVHEALISLGADDRRRLGVTAHWKGGPHLLTYRQTEYTFGLVAGALGKDEPDGLPPGPLQRVCDGLLEASVPEEFKDASRSLAVDWTDLESFSRPPPHGTLDCAGPEASTTWANDG